VIRVVFGGQPYIHRGFHEANRFPGQENEPVVIDASFSYEPDGAGLCFRWECVEPSTCKENTIIGATVLQGAGKDKVSEVCCELSEGSMR
jgi:hypothetical protein